MSGALVLIMTSYCRVLAMVILGSSDSLEKLTSYSSAPAGKFLPKFPSTLFVRTGASNENCSFSRNVKGKEISGDTVCSNAFDYNSMKSPDLLLKGSTSIAAGLTTEVS
jgi:hypothetical protein